MSVESLDAWLSDGTDHGVVPGLGRSGALGETGRGAAGFDPTDKILDDDLDEDDLFDDEEGEHDDYGELDEFDEDFDEDFDDGSEVDLDEEDEF